MNLLAGTLSAWHFQKIISCISQTSFGIATIIQHPKILPMMFLGPTSLLHLLDLWTGSQMHLRFGNAPEVLAQHQRTAYSHDGMVHTTPQCCCTQCLCMLLANCSSGGACSAQSWIVNWFLEDRQAARPWSLAMLQRHLQRQTGSSAAFDRMWSAIQTSLGEGSFPSVPGEPQRLMPPQQPCSS